MWNHPRTLAVALGGSALFTLTVDLCGETIDEDFEAYAPGTFPSPPWLDVGLVNAAPPNPPDPSATVRFTTAASGFQTRALGTVEAIAPSQGIYQVVGESCSFRVTADVRIDQWADAPPDPNDDWAIQVGVVQLQGDTDFAFCPNLGIYASSHLQEWRVYARGTAAAFSDFSLGVPVELGTWYRVQMELESATGLTRSQIWDAASGSLLVDLTAPVSDWTPQDGQYNAVAFFEGELSPEVTIANVAVVDNISVQVGLIGDINVDGVVNVLDLVDLLLCFGQPADPLCDTADVNSDGTVNLLDLIALLLAFGTTCP